MRGLGRAVDGLALLLIDPDEHRSLVTVRAIERTVLLHPVVKESAREALAALTNERFDAIVCRQELGDTDCWRFLRLLRSGRFGSAATPVLVLCASAERAALTPMADEHTGLLIDGDASEFDSELCAARAGMRRASVLIVHDEEPDARAAAAALEPIYHVESARVGAAALALWRVRRHGLVVLDLMGGDGSSRELLSSLLAEHPQQAVIVLTAQDALQSQRELLLAGAAECLAKPVDARVLVQSCARTLHSQECLSHARHARAQAASLRALVNRVQAAHYLFEHGQSAQADAHLTRALLEHRTRAPSDDEWAQLLGEFEHE